MSVCSSFHRVYMYQYIAKDQEANVLRLTAGAFQSFGDTINGANAMLVYKTFPGFRYLKVNNSKQLTKAILNLIR